MKDYICDRCGKHIGKEGYVVENDEVLTFYRVNECRFQIEANSGDGWEYIDLCPECEKELMRWLKNESNISD